MRLHRVVTGGVALLSIAFCIYLGVLYGQLKTAFNRQVQFVPTRIYSDVTRISTPETRAYVEEKLKNLAYVTSSTGNEIHFRLHSSDYPSYLIPDNHPQIAQMGSPDGAQADVTLSFSGTGGDDLLQSVHLGGKEVQDLYLEPELVTTLTRSGKLQDGKKEIRTLLKFDEVPALMWKAIIATEDNHFLEHSGLDPRGLARAILIDLRTRSLSQGGSTITQQLVKNLMARHTRNVIRKFNELFLALLLEATFDKETILERYLNEVYLGQVGSFEIHGVAEGAEHFFAKDVKDLNLAEMAMMAGLIRGPGYYSPYRYRERAIERQRFVLKRMVETGQIAQSEANAALKQPIRLAPPSTIANKAPYFTDFVKAELLRQLKGRMTEEEVTEAGFRVYTTLDLTLNTAAQNAVARGISGLEKNMKLGTTDRLEGALASVDHNTGYIRALVGGRSYAESTFNRILNMRRQVGSTFKPIVYLTALQKGRDPKGVPYGPGHPVEDSAWTLVYDHGRQEWSPKNYEKEYMGWISYRTALAHSINTATARLGFEVGIDNVIKTARALGIEADLPAVPSLSLGVAELTPIELLQAYAIFANHGVQDELTVIRSITHEDGSDYARFVYHPKQIFNPGPTDLLTDMLQSVFTEGTAKEAVRMGFDRPAAGKTGTTSHHRDAWFAGYTPQLTTVVWVGMDQPRADSKVKLTGANSALPIWTDYMKKALEGEPPTPFPLSQYLSNVSIDTRSGLLSDGSCYPNQVITEKYEKENEPRSSGCSPVWPDSVPKTVAQ
jgi:1A family penicillin-binding protein